MNVISISSQLEAGSPNARYGKTQFFQARALRALGLLLADGAPTVGGEKTF